MKKKIGQTIIGLIVVMVVGMFIVGLVAPKEKPGTPMQAVIAASQRQPIPAEQAALSEIVGRYAEEYDAAANDMLKGGTRPQRARAICAALSRPDVRNWIGTLSTPSSNADGNGVLAVQIARSLTVKTWNNDFSDISDHTLIPHGSALYIQASALKEGMAVVFSGSFIPDRTDCLRETSLSVAGAMTDPEFLFRFTAIAPVQ